ncbi:hypothetical protein LTR08_006832 [Meristemomyces frigidus]|nr:hypothetical protein LTR08_006832 [Meristemomyces frigidus]
MPARPTYTHAQLEQYFDRVSLPPAKRIYTVSQLPDAAKLTFLHLLQHHQLVKVPWENLTQHYSWHRVVNTKPQHLFTKIVHSPGGGRGGYCMEANHFFHTVLLSLGYDVYMAGSRIHYGDGVYGGWSHVVNLVTIAGVKYFLDGGFGPQGPTRPVPLRAGEVGEQIAPAQMRLVWEAIPPMLDQGQRIWVYQYRVDAQSEWRAMYCFPEVEFTPTDIEGMNFSPWLNRQSFFTHKVVAVRFTTEKEVVGDGAGPGAASEEALEGEIDGSISVNQDVLKWRRRGEKVVELKFTNEEERVEALERYFGITLADEDREAIKGTASAIGGMTTSLD